MEHHTNQNFRERLALALFESAVAAGLESGQLDYETQKPEYLKFADELMHRCFDWKTPDAQRHDLPHRSQGHPYPFSG